MLRRSRYLVPVAGLLVLALAGCSHEPVAGGDASANDKPGVLGALFDTTKPITVPAGTGISVVLDQAVSSAANRPGDKFEASIAEPIVWTARP